MNSISVQKFPLVDNMRKNGGNFVSKLAEAMVAADPVNFSRLCDAFPEIVAKYDEESPGHVVYTWTDTRRINLIADGMPEAKHKDRAGRVWWGVPARSDEETGERYQASWDLREEPHYGATCWMPANDLREPLWAEPEDTYGTQAA